MSGSPWGRLPILFCLAVPLLSRPAPGDEESGWPEAPDGCTECHALFPVPEVSRPISQHRADIHGRSGVGCTGCHGGDPKERMDAVLAHDEKRNFVSVERLRKNVESRCGTCHPGPKKEFLQGEHAPNRGKEVPRCNTCHYSDHLTRTKVGEIATRSVCGGCHEAGMVASFRAPFDSKGDLLERARRWETDPRAWLVLRESATGDPARFDLSVEELLASRERFREVSHRVDLPLLAVAGDKLQEAAALLEPRAAHFQVDFETRAWERNYVRILSGIVLLLGILLLLRSR